MSSQCGNIVRTSTIGLIHRREANPAKTTKILKRRSHRKRASIVSDFLSIETILIFLQFKIATTADLALRALKTRPKRTFKARLTRSRSWNSKRLKLPTKPKNQAYSYKGLDRTSI